MRRTPKDEVYDELDEPKGRSPGGNEEAKPTNNGVWGGAPVTRGRGEAEDESRAAGGSGLIIGVWGVAPIMSRRLPFWSFFKRTTKKEIKTI